MENMAGKKVLYRAQRCTPEFLALQSRYLRLATVHYLPSSQHYTDQKIKARAELVA